MAKYYLDIETYGTEGKPNPKKDKIITIQYQMLDNFTGKPIGPLSILKEWESSEEEILGNFLKVYKPWKTPWDFIPVGNGLHFERSFLKEKSRKYGVQELLDTDLDYHVPHIDVQPIIVIINRGQFKGSGMHHFTEKKVSGIHIKDWYEGKDYNQIEKYVKEEANAFIDLYSWLCKELPGLHSSWKNGFKSSERDE